jgi:hypothetical protein
MNDKQNDIAPLDAVNQIFNSDEQLMRRVAQLEEDSNSALQNISQYYVQGRLRTNRAAPTTSTDIVGTDTLWDRVIAYDSGSGFTYEYILSNKSGTLLWWQSGPYKTF